TPSKRFEQFLPSSRVIRNLPIFPCRVTQRVTQNIRSRCPVAQDTPPGGSVLIWLAHPTCTNFALASWPCKMSNPDDSTIFAIRASKHQIEQSVFLVF